MKKLGSELDFISQINRDGSGTTPVCEEQKRVLQDDKFKIRCLSMSEETYLAMDFNSFVVRLKNKLVNP